MHNIFNHDVSVIQEASQLNNELFLLQRQRAYVKIVALEARVLRSVSQRSLGEWSPDMASDMYGILGKACEIQNRHTQAREYLTKCLEFARDHMRPADVSRQMTALGELCIACCSLCLYDEALSAGTKQLELSTRKRDKAGARFAYMRLGSTLFAMKRYEEAVTHLTTALQLNQRFEDPVSQLIVQTNLGAAHRMLGRLHQAGALYKNTLAAREKAGDLLGQARSCGLLGSLALEQCMDDCLFLEDDAPAAHGNTPKTRQIIEAQAAEGVGWMQKSLTLCAHADAPLGHTMLVQVHLCKTTLRLHICVRSVRYRVAKMQRMPGLFPQKIH